VAFVGSEYPIYLAMGFKVLYHIDLRVKEIGSQVLTLPH
jgi:hypothetical protein